MNPWQTVWAPNVHLPLSGNFEQRVAPKTNWFFDGIDANAGNARIEQKVFEKASYGKQIGWLTEVLLALVDATKQTPALDTGPHAPLTRLRKLRKEIEDLKQAEATTTAEEVEARVRWLKQHSPKEYEALAARLADVLQPGPG